MADVAELQGIDCIATDPPYGIEELVGGYGRGGRTIANDRTLDVCHEGLRLAALRLESGYIAAFYSPRVTPAFHVEATLDAEHCGELCWDKKAPGMGGKGLRYQHESIALWKRGDPPDMGPIFSVLPYYRAGEVHPHEKPIPLMKRLLASLGGTAVLDPFMGSGSTGVAAVDLGRRFVGVELDEGHFATACARIEEVQRQDCLL
jgi:site-specific DNA-methyltransferase (adenine-specific)